MNTWRHTVPDSDPLVTYLQELEVQFTNESNSTDLAKIQAIRVHETYIEIANLRLQRKNVGGVVEKGKTIEHLGNTFFTLYQARELFGSKIPSTPQWEAIISAIPWREYKIPWRDYSKEKTNYFMHILEIPNTGRYDELHGFGPYFGIRAILWSSYFDEMEEVECVSIGNYLGIETQERGWGYHYYSVRLLA